MSFRASPKKEALPIALLQTIVAPKATLGLSPDEALYEMPFIWMETLIDNKVTSLGEYAQVLNQFQSTLRKFGLNNRTSSDNSISFASAWHSDISQSLDRQLPSLPASTCLKRALPCSSILSHYSKASWDCQLDTPYQSEALEVHPGRPIH